MTEILEIELRSAGASAKNETWLISSSDKRRVECIKAHINVSLS